MLPFERCIDIRLGTFISVLYLPCLFLYKIHCCTLYKQCKRETKRAKKCYIFSYYVFSCNYICKRILEILLFQCTAAMANRNGANADVQFPLFLLTISIDHFLDKFSQMEHFIFPHLREHIIVPMSMRTLIDVRLRIQPAQS